MRTLFIDFDLYAEDDPDFKLELIALMIDNLNELHAAYGVSINQKEPMIFRKAYHKVKTTIAMLEDPELNAVVEELKNPDVDPSIVSRFGNIITELIESLSGVK